jgi:hypothetical protein
MAFLCPSGEATLKAIFPVPPGDFEDSLDLLWAQLGLVLFAK